VFNAEVVYAGIASAAGACNGSMGSFDPVDGRVRVSWNYHDYISRNICTRAIDPASINADLLNRLNPDKFQLEFQIETLITAISVNTGILNIDQLSAAEPYNPATAFLFRDKKYVFVPMFYDRFSLMDKVWCLFPVDQTGNYFIPTEVEQANYPLPPVCLMKSKVGKLYSIPLFSHIFNGCRTCPPVQSTEPIPAPEDICDEQMFFASLLQLKSFDVIEVLGKFYKSYGPKYYYPLMWSAREAAQYTVFAGANEAVTNKFDFCGSSDNCSMLSVGFIKFTNELNEKSLQFPFMNYKDLYTTPHW
jgi:hypothetical protein